MKTREQTVQARGNGRHQRPGISGFVALILFIMVFSGALKDVPVLKALDFNNMMGAFGVVKGAEGNFQGVGGVGAKDGFMVAFAQLPLLRCWPWGLWSWPPSTGRFWLPRYCLHPF